MLDEDTKSQIRVSCDCDGGNWVIKIMAEKIVLTFSIFSAAIFVTQFPLHNHRTLEFAILRLHQTVLRILNNFKFSKLLMRKIGSRKSRPKNFKTVWFFRSWFSLTNDPHTLPSPSQSLQNPQWVTKIAPKNQKRRFDFFSRDFYPSLPFTIIADPRIHDI